MGKFFLDERSKRKLYETSLAVLGLFYVIYPFEMLIKIYVTHDYLSVLGDLIIFFSVIFTFPIVQKLNRNYTPTLPRKNNGEEFSCKKTKESKQKRMLTYAKESFIFAITMTVFSTIMDSFLNKQSIILNLNFIISQLVEIIGYFIVSFILDNIYKERKIKKYNKWNERLDD